MTKALSYDIQVTSSGVIATYAGLSPWMLLSAPMGIALAPSGDVYIANNNHVISKVTHLQVVGSRVAFDVVHRSALWAR